MKTVWIGIWIPKLRKTQESDIISCIRAFSNSLDSYWIKYFIELPKWIADEINKSNKQKQKK